MSAIAAWELAPVPATSGALRPARHLHVVSAPDRVQEGRSGRHSARGAQGLRLTFAGQIVVAIVAALLVFALAVAVTRVTASSAAPVGPVSYTHLDVYKRQAPDVAPSARSPAG